MSHIYRISSNTTIIRGCKIITSQKPPTLHHITVKLLYFSARTGYASSAERKSSTHCWAHSCQQNLFPLTRATERYSSTNLTAPTARANEITNQTREAVHDWSGGVRESFTNKGNDHRQPFVLFECLGKILCRRWQFKTNASKCWKSITEWKTVKHHGSMVEQFQNMECVQDQNDEKNVLNLKRWMEDSQLWD